MASKRARGGPTAAVVGAAAAGAAADATALAVFRRAGMVASGEPRASRVVTRFAGNVSAIAQVAVLIASGAPLPVAGVARLIATEVAVPANILATDEFIVPRNAAACEEHFAIPVARHGIVPATAVEVTGRGRAGRAKGDLAIRHRIRINMAIVAGEGDGRALASDRASLLGRAAEVGVAPNIVIPT